MVRRGDGGEFDIGAIGKDRVVFEQRADLLEIEAVGIVDEEDGMGVAHVDGAGRVQDRIVDRADLKLEMRGVVERLRQRDVLPAELRRTHVDGEDEVAVAPGRQQPGLGLQGQRGLGGIAHHGIGQHRPGDAARAVAAGAGLGAIGIVDPDIGVGAGRDGIVQDHELVEMRARLSRDGAGIALGDAQLRPAKSSTVISLPRPFIFRNRRWARAFIPSHIP